MACKLCSKIHRGQLKKVCNACLDTKFTPEIRAEMLLNFKKGIKKNGDTKG